MVLGAVGAAVWASGSRDVDSARFVSKLAVTIVLGALAAWTAKQSSRHRRREEAARALEMDMAAFPPFIERMSPENQEKARGKMFDISFGRPLLGGQDGGPSVVDALRRGGEGAPDVDAS